MKSFVALAAATLVAGTLAAPTAAFAGGHHHGDAVAAGALGFLGGMIVGGALAQPAPEPVYVQPRPVYVVDPGAAHVRWCEAHYRSYSVYDNTFIDRYGRIRACVSPYLR